MLRGLRKSHDASVPTERRWTTAVNPARTVSKNALQDDTDYSDPAAVENVRAAIVRMEVWHGIAEWAFQEGCANEAVAAIAKMTLCARAAGWQRANPDRQAVAGLDPEELVQAQITLLRLLSTRGADAMTHQCEMLRSGIRYTPQTACPQADELLGMTLRDAALEHAAQAWEAIGQYRHAVVAYNKLGKDAANYGQSSRAAWAYEQAARICVANGLFVRASRLYKKAATAWRADRRLVEAARACESAAEASKVAGRLDGVANAYVTMAGLWVAQNHPAQAASAYEKAAVAWEVARMSRCAAKGWKRAATCWLAAGQGQRAARARAEQAMCLNSPALIWLKQGRPERVACLRRQQAKAWQAAGLPDRAARSWKEALLLTGPEAAAADEIASEGAPLFQVDLDYEETGGE